MSDRLAEYRAFIASKHAAQAAKIIQEGANKIGNLLDIAE
jgi:hypothetical protein